MRLKKIMMMAALTLTIALVGCSSTEEAKTDVVTMNANPTEIIVNGDFSSNDNTGWTKLDSAGDSWGGEGGIIEFSFSNGVASGTIIKGDSSVNYESQLYQFVPLKAKKTYKISFDYTATEDAEIALSIENGNDYTAYLVGAGNDNKARVKATESMQTYELTFEAPVTDNKSKLVFLLSSAPTNSVVTIDNVSLLEY